MCQLLVLPFIKEISPTFFPIPHLRGASQGGAPFFRAAASLRKVPKKSLPRNFRGGAFVSSPQNLHTPARQAPQACGPT